MTVNINNKTLSIQEIFDIYKTTIIQADGEWSKPSELLQITSMDEHNIAKNNIIKW